MKRCILTVLRIGYTTTKKYTLDDLCGYLFPLRHILTVNHAGMICCNLNGFWRAENNEKRMALYWDIKSIQGPSIKDHARFTIYNRFANGDRYGIEIEEA